MPGPRTSDAVARISGKFSYRHRIRVMGFAGSPVEQDSDQALSLRNLTEDYAEVSDFQFINFEIGADQYGVDITAVREIKEWSEITHLPRQPDYVRGVLNLRGVIIPIIDLRCRFAQGLTEASTLHVIIIVQIGTQIVGLLADRVLDIIPFDKSKIKPVPRIAQSTLLNLLSGIATVEGVMIALIDLRNLLGRKSDETACNISHADPRVHLN